MLKNQNTRTFLVFTSMIPSPHDLVGLGNNFMLGSKFFNQKTSGQPKTKHPKPNRSILILTVEAPSQHPAKILLRSELYNLLLRTYCTARASDLLHLIHSCTRLSIVGTVNYISEHFDLNISSFIKSTIEI